MASFATWYAEMDETLERLANEQRKHEISVALLKAEIELLLEKLKHTETDSVLEISTREHRKKKSMWFTCSQILCIN